jgi:AcrR family transcriptional regulator
MSHRAGLDKARIVKAAAELVNTEGLEALSLNRLAQELGVRTPSLYNHIDGLPGLHRELALLSTRDLGERLGNAAMGKSGVQAVLQVAQAYREYIKEYPDLYTLGLRAGRRQDPNDIELQAAQDRVVEIGLAVVSSFGLEGEDGLHAVRAVRSVVHGFATLEVTGGFGLPLDCDASFQRLVLMLVHGLGQADNHPEHL